jgi:hypothetical protein
MSSKQLYWLKFEFRLSYMSKVSPANRQISSASLSIPSHPITDRADQMRNRKLQTMVENISKKFNHRQKEETQQISMISRLAGIHSQLVERFSPQLRSVWGISPEFPWGNHHYEPNNAEIWLLSVFCRSFQNAERRRRFKEPAWRQ